MQMGAGRVDVVEQPVVGQPFEQRQHLGEVVIRRGASAGPVEDVESEPDVTRQRDAFGDALDVIVQPERLRDDDDSRGRGTALGGRLVCAHRPIGCGEGQISFGHAANLDLRSCRLPSARD